MGRGVAFPVGLGLEGRYQSGKGNLPTDQGFGGGITNPQIELSGWNVLFHGPTVRQERNEHNLMRDFKDEVPGYLHNASIREALGGLKLARGASNIHANLRACYAKLIEMTLVGERELELLDAWIEDLGSVL